MRVRGVIVLGCLLGAAAQAQPVTPAPAGTPAKKKPATLAELASEVETLRAEVASAVGAAADAASAKAAASDLEARLAALAEEVAALQRGGVAGPDLATTLDRLNARVSVLEASLQEVKVVVALPPTPAPAAAEAAPVLGLGPPIPMADESPSKNDVIFLRDPNGKLAMSLRGFMQVRYVLDHEGDPRHRIIASGFNLERARLTLSGWALSQKLRYRVHLEVGKAAEARDVFMEYQPEAWLWVRGGQFKVPLLRQVLASDEGTLFADRAQFVARQNQRDVGVTVGGAFAGGKVGYQVAALNGAGQNKVNENIDLRYTARVTAAPLGALARNEGDVKGEAKPLVELSLAGMYDLTPNGDLDGDGKLDDVDGDGRPDNAQVLAGAVSLAARWQGAALEAEYLGKREDEGAGRDARTLHSWYVQASYHLKRGFMFGARFGAEQPSPLGLSQTERTALPEQRYEASGLLGWLKSGHPMRVNLEFTEFTEQAPGKPDRKVHRGLAQAQISF